MPARVLLVDPDEDILQAFARSLARRGFDVLTASNERDCVRHLCESAPEVVVLEPVTDNGWGFRLLTNQDGRVNRAIPTVVVSILNANEMPPGFDELTTIHQWHTKPVASEDLAHSITRIVRTVY